MDKVAKYKKIARQIAEEVGNLGQASNGNVATQLITDDEHGHYLLYFTVGGMKKAVPMLFPTY